MQSQGMRIVALVVLVVALLGLAYAIEETARPDTGRRGQKVEAGHDGHSH